MMGDLLRKTLQALCSLLLASYPVGTISVQLSATSPSCLSQLLWRIGFEGVSSTRMLALRALMLESPVYSIVTSKDLKHRRGRCLRDGVSNALSRFCLGIIGPASLAVNHKLSQTQAAVPLLQGCSAARGRSKGYKIRDQVCRQPVVRALR